jgi:hypothetical protein
VPSSVERAFARLAEPRVRTESPARIARALAALAKAAARDATLLLRFHDRLLFLLAYPPSEAIRRRCEARLSGIPRRVRALEASGEDVSVFDEPEAAGVGGTTIATDYSYDLARILRRRHGRRISIDWAAADAWDRARATWPSFLPLLEEEALADANVPYPEWLRAAAGARAGDPAWLLDRYGRLPLPKPDRGEHWDALGVPVSWDLGDSRLSRTRTRRPGPPRFFHPGPLLARRDVSLARVFAEPRIPARRLSRRDGERVCALVQDATAARYREFYTFTYADPSSVVAARPGRGVEIFLLGVQPDRRLPLRSAYGGFIVKNGVPVGYIEGLAFFERLEIGFNLYYAFREGESAWIYAQVLKLHREALGVTSFSVDPYQLGFENSEAIDSGAFWFYRKLGFRPSDAGVAEIVAREERRMKADPAHRSSRRTLSHLVTHNVLYEAPGTGSGDWDRFHVRRLGLFVNRRMASRFGGDADRMRERSRARVARILGIRERRLSPRELQSFEDFSLLLEGVPDLARWSRAERDDLAAIIRAKAGRSERRYLELLRRHRRLRRAVLRLGSLGG